MSKKAITARFEEKIFEEISQKAKSRNNSKAELIRKFVTEGLNFESEKNDINEINKKIDSILETINLLISENQKLNTTNERLENNIFQIRKDIIVSTFLGEKSLANNYSILKNITKSNLDVLELIEKAKEEAKSKAAKIIKNEMEY